MLNNWNKLKKFYVVWYYLYDILEKVKPKGQKSDPWLSGAADGETQLTAKEYKETFWCDGNILYLDCGSNYITLCIYENSLKCTPKKERILLYVNYIPINLIPKLKKKTQNFVL